MPEFLITSPEGKQYRVTGPDGSTKDQALAHLQQQLAAQPQRPLPAEPGYTTERGSALPPTPSRGAPEGERLIAGTREAGSKGLSYTTPEGPAWKTAQNTLLELERQGVPKTDPRYQQAIKDRALGFERLTSGAVEAQPAAEGLGLAIRGIGAVARPAIGKVGRAIGGATERAAEGLRGQAVGETERAIAAKEAAARPLDQRVQSIGKAQEQLERQPEIAAERAAAKAPGPDPLRGRTIAAARERVRNAERDWREAGATAQQAKDLAQQHEVRVRAAEQAVGDLEQQMAARPMTTPEQFGQQLRAATKAIADKFGRIRAKQSGFAEALESAGDAPRVQTQGIARLISGKLKDIRNPNLEGLLEEVQGQIGGKTISRPATAAQGLSIKQAESLRGYLDSIIQSRMFKDRKIDKETLAAIADIKKELVREATKYEPYRTALAKWRTLSRPLDIVERKGALRKVLDSDPVSTDYAATEAQVVGQVIQKARQGNPVFTRLLEESPGIKDGARLYFTRELFAEGKTPSVASLKTWLKNNEGPLRQTGLYDEFRDMRAAREAAQRAVDEAKGDFSRAAREAKTAADAEQAAQRRMAVQERVRDLAKNRPDAEVLSVKIRERSEADATRRATQAGSRLERERATAQSGADKARAAQDEFRKFRTEITTARPADVPNQTKAFVSSLRDRGLIGDTKYGEYLRQIQKVQDGYKETREARKLFLKIAGAAAAAGGVYEGYRVGSSFVR